jgi:chemotaxis protein methyltransferase CheR
MEKLETPRPDTLILATDISGRALKAAQQGAYAEQTFRGLGPAWRRQFLLRGEGRWEGWYRFKPVVRQQVRFKYLNLNESFASAGLFDIIFCRNVMIYFDEAEQKRLVEKFHRCLNSDGYLFVGHAESLFGLTKSFHMIHQNNATVYQRVEGAQ